MEKIVVANQKGGVGKTDLSVNISSCLAKLGKKILLIDFDPQANSTDYLSKEKYELTASDLILKDDVGVKDVIRKTKIKNLDLIPSSGNLSSAQAQLINEIGMEFKLKKKLKSLKGYDYVFIDTPPSLGPLTVNALTASDKIVMPIQVHYFAMDGVAKLARTIKNIREEVNPALDIGGIVLTMFDKRNNLSFEVEKKVREAFGKMVFKTIIPINVKLAEAPSHHKPIIKYASWSRGAKAYLKLAKELMKRERKARR